MLRCILFVMLVLRIARPSGAGYLWTKVQRHLPPNVCTPNRLLSYFLLSVDPVGIQLQRVLDLCDCPVQHDHRAVAVSKSGTSPSTSLVNTVSLLNTSFLLPHACCSPISTSVKRFGPPTRASCNRLRVCLPQQACCGPGFELHRTFTSVGAGGACSPGEAKRCSLRAREGPNRYSSQDIDRRNREPWFPPRFGRRGQRHRQRQRNRRCQNAVASTSSPSSSQGRSLVEADERRQ